MRDIEDLADIKTFVNEFYTKVQDDELLAPVFAQKIEGNDWTRHLNRMYDFWNTILFFQPGYKGSAFSKHVGLGAKPHHFKRWIKLFEETIDENFEGDKATDAKSRVNNMGALFSAKLEHIDKNPGYKHLF